jgi:hypothetical protein
MDQRLILGAAGKLQVTRELIRSRGTSSDFSQEEIVDSVMQLPPFEAG